MKRPIVKAVARPARGAARDRAVTKEARPVSGGGSRPKKASLPDKPLLFDEDYYLQRNPEAATGGMSPWEHFLKIGAAQGRDPHWLFSIRFYRANNRGIGTANPLIHFLEHGIGGRQPFHWMFSEVLYARLNLDLASWHQEPLIHFLKFGQFESRIFHPLFDPGHYRREHPDLANSSTPLFKHFVVHGDREGRSPHPLFDAAYYRARHAVPPGTGAFEDFVSTAGGRQTHPLFDPRHYAAARPSEPASEAYPLLDYVVFGAQAGVPPHHLVDPAYYRTQTNDPYARRDALSHYLEIGRKHGLSPTPLFDPGCYGTQSPRTSWTGGEMPTTGPRISILVPVFNTPGPVLRACIDSVRAQSYTDWELCMVDDTSTRAETVMVLESYRGSDERIRIERLTHNQHIARATNIAALQASGEFLAFLDHDDTIEPDALAQIAAGMMADPEADVFYTDEDKLDARGAFRDTYHKPDWSPEHLRSVMYLLHFLVVRKALFWRIGGSRPERTGAQDYDLALRATREARRVCHVPRVLYHWRMLEGSAAAAVDAKPYGLEAARAALEDRIKADGEDAVVEDGLVTGTFRVRNRLSAAPPVCLLVFTNDSERDVPGRGRINLVRHFLESVAASSTYSNYRLKVVDNGNASAATKRLVKQLGGTIASFKFRGSFSYAAKANFATAQADADAEHLIYLNDDLEVITPGWIEALLELTQNPEIGGAGARLLYPDGRIQHSGIILGAHDATGHAFLGLDRGVVGYNNFTHVIRNYSAVTGAVFATRRSVMQEVKGFDERLAIDYNDIDLCLRIRSKGYRIAFTPFSELYHFEGSTAVRTAADAGERELFRTRWKDLIAADPYYNPNLPRDRLGFQ